MIRRAIASFKKQSEDGFTLIELMVVLLILTTLIALGIPTLNKIVEEAKVRKYVAEAEMVCAAFGVYVAEYDKDKQLDIMDLAYDLLGGYPLGHSRNALTEQVGTVTKGARIAEFSLGAGWTGVRGIVYEVDGYTIDVCPAEREPLVTRE